MERFDDLEKYRQNFYGYVISRLSSVIFFALLECLCNLSYFECSWIGSSILWCINYVRRSGWLLGGNFFYEWNFFLIVSHWICFFFKFQILLFTSPAVVENKNNGEWPETMEGGLISRPIWEFYALCKVSKAVTEITYDGLPDMNEISRSEQSLGDFVCMFIAVWIIFQSSLVFPYDWVIFIW